MTINQTMDVGLGALAEGAPTGALVAGVTAMVGAAIGVAAMKITAQSHMDHGLGPQHRAWLEDRYKTKNEFFMETVDLPPELSDLESGLHGPIAGDPPVPESEVHYAIRGTRPNASRLVKRPKRPTRKVTVIAGPTGDESCVLYTAFGGPLAPREPGDVSIPNWEGVVEARKFWAEHALTDEKA